MCKRIYKEYKLKVNGELLKLNGNVDMTSYSNAVKVYKNTKDKYSEVDEDTVIELVGVNEDGTVGNTIYKKEFIKEENNNYELLKSTDDIVSEIAHLLILLEEKKEYHSVIQSALDKKENVKLHNIENISKFKGSKEDLIKEKLKIFDEIESIRVERRFHKEEAMKLISLNRRIHIKDISDKFSKIEIPIDKNVEYLTEEKLDELCIIKEITYNSDKQRINLMKQIQNKYKKVVNDVKNSKLICYNLANNRK